jgi:hypothetical protein
MSENVSKLVPRIPRVTQAQLDAAGANTIAELALHRALYQVEGGHQSEFRSIDRFPVLVVAWNRCTEIERARFVRLLGDTIEEYLIERSEQARRIAKGVSVRRTRPTC